MTTPFEDIPETEVEMPVVASESFSFAPEKPAIERGPQPLVTIMAEPEATSAEQAAVPEEIAETVFSFKEDWQSGLHPRIEDLLEDSPKDLHDKLLSALLRI